ncbi:MAG TPA: hypothetical protein VMJ31_05735 [Methylocystis sp.]|nr:hypothetical protein [Methylocystis sp.]
MTHPELGAWFLLAAAAAIVATVIVDAVVEPKPKPAPKKPPDFLDENWAHLLGAEIVAFEIWFLLFTL